MTPASRACSFPLQLSPSGEPDGPETSLRVSPDCVRDSAPRSAAHGFAASGFPTGFTNRPTGTPDSAPFVGPYSSFRDRRTVGFGVARPCGQAPGLLVASTAQPKSGPFPPPALPGFLGTTNLSASP